MDLNFLFYEERVRKDLCDLMEEGFDKGIVGFGVECKEGVDKKSTEDLVFARAGRIIRGEIEADSQTLKHYIQRLGSFEGNEGGCLGGNEGTDDFETAREKGSYLIDETGFVYGDVCDRDRRPHMSYSGICVPCKGERNDALYVSTIQCIFEGKKELFEGLAFAGKKWNWEAETRPVIRLNFGECRGNLEEAMRGITAELFDASYKLGASAPVETDLSKAFSDLIEEVAMNSPTGQVVLLIEEYDKLFSEFYYMPFEMPEVQRRYNFCMRFLSVIRKQCAKLRFVYLNGRYRQLMMDAWNVATVR